MRIVLDDAARLRFLRKVKVRRPNQCWEYQSGKSGTGYGAFKLKGKQLGAHRVAYVIGHGKQPGRLHVCHDCDNRKCCNPAHLFLGTRADNMHDMVRKGRSVQGTKNRTAKLNANDVRSIRRSTKTNAALARKHRVCEATISHIKTGRNWKHLLP